MRKRASSRLVVGVVLTEPVAYLWADDRLVEHFHDIVLDVLPCKAGQPARKAHDKLISTGNFSNPVKEVSFDHATNLRVGE